MEEHPNAQLWRQNQRVNCKKLIDTNQKTFKKVLEVAGMLGLTLGLWLEGKLVSQASLAAHTPRG